MIDSLGIAIERAVLRRFTDVAFRVPTFLGALMAMDTFYGRQMNKSFDPLAVKGGEMRFLFETGLPDWEGAPVPNEDLSQAILSPQKRHQLRVGKLGPTAKTVLEGVEKYDVNRLANDPDLQASYVDMAAEAVLKGFVLHINEDLFPVANVVGGTTGGVNPGNRGSLPALSYFLQTGFTNNAATASGSETYFYLNGLDLNATDNAPLKAKNVGTVGSAVTLSYDELDESLLLPIRADGGRPDIVLCHKDAYVWLKKQLRSTLRQPAETEVMKYGGPFFEYEGIRFVYEPRLDLQAVKELLVLDSSTWRFGLDGNGASSKTAAKSNIKVIPEVPGAPSLHYIQGYLECGLVCTNPAYNGRMFNVSVPA